MDINNVGNYLELKMGFRGIFSYGIAHGLILAWEEELRGKIEIPLNSIEIWNRAMRGRNCQAYCSISRVRDWYGICKKS